MGGYGAYVWSAFGLTFLVLAGLFVQSVALGRRREAELATLRQRLREQRARPARPLAPRREPAPATATPDRARG